MDFNYDAETKPFALKSALGWKPISSLLRSPEVRWMTAGLKNGQRACAGTRS